MQLGMSRIRSAGRTSGSIEITLPPVLQVFTGLSCRVTVRDGVQPEIVLQPDLAKARSLIEALWQKLALALGSTDLVEGFAPSIFVHTLLPRRQLQQGLPLAYADVMSLARSGAERTTGDLEALARIVSVLAAAIGRSLGLEPAFAFGFGDAVAYVVTEESAGLGSDFERSMAAGILRQAQLERRRLASAFDDKFWLECEPALRRVCAQFHAWQSNPEAFEAARLQWHRALQCEGVPGRTGARRALQNF